MVSGLGLEEQRTRPLRALREPRASKSRPSSGRNWQELRRARPEATTRGNAREQPAVRSVRPSLPSSTGTDRRPRVRRRRLSAIMIAAGLGANPIAIDFSGDKLVFARKCKCCARFMSASFAVPMERAETLRPERREGDSRGECERTMILFAAMLARSAFSVVPSSCTSSPRAETALRDARQKRRTWRTSHLTSERRNTHAAYLGDLEHSNHALQRQPPDVGFVFLDQIPQPPCASMRTSLLPSAMR